MKINILIFSKLIFSFNWTKQCWSGFIDLSNYKWQYFLASQGQLNNTGISKYSLLFFQCYKVSLITFTSTISADIGNIAPELIIPLQPKKCDAWCTFGSKNACNIIICVCILSYSCFCNCVMKWIVVNLFLSRVSVKL